MDYDGKVHMGVTSLSTYQNCKMKWYMQSFLRYTSTRVVKEMYIGTLVHAGLEGFYETFLPYEDMRGLPQEVYDAAEEEGFSCMGLCMRSERAKMNRHPSDLMQWEDTAFSIIENYFRYGDPFFFKRVIAVEKDVFEESEFSILRGTIDLIVENFDGTISIVDHKCRGQKMQNGMDLLTIDTQMQLYAYLAKEYSPVTIVHNVLLRRVPKIFMLKNGNMSTARTRTAFATPHLVKQELTRVIETASEETLQNLCDLVDKLEATVNDTFFQRVSVAVNEGVVEAAALTAYILMNDAQELVESFYKTDDASAITRNAGTYQCKKCALLSFCAASLRDENAEKFLEADFYIRE